MPPCIAGLPARAGAGFKPQHLDAWLNDADAPAFAEVHAENYMGQGGAPHRWLRLLRERGPVSVHGVGLSIGAQAPLDTAHLERLAALVARCEPAAVSEHLAWSTHDGIFLADLLPVRYDACALDRVCEHVDRVQSRLRRRILIENPASYVEFAASSMDEATFLARLVQRTGCGLLLDVNNLYVSCSNSGSDARVRLAAFPLAAVEQVHLAGHAVDIGGETGGGVDPSAAVEPVLVDTHGGPVSAAVWALYARLLAATGPLPTLIEWDTDVPGYATLRREVRRADAVLAARRGDVRAAA
ncbi:DUF692 domain-containing protein [Chiayiivirga flava]|uniref:Uncharacterized protein n=1 Tax=Chiayiivirga flava TaxID=659595 RepID=A0A7W8D4D5_9GAMM|nr:DUF692 domain-containing protein [Chiayiivirga flava]MBB5206565.1 hypothetical protein [Chiayiivirga flava]